MANLYVFHQGIGGENMFLWYSVFDGTNWYPDTQILGTTPSGSNLDLASPPSAIVWDGVISVLHQGWFHTVPGAPDGRLWQTYSTDGADWGSDRLVPNVYLSESPSAVFYNGLAYVFHQGQMNDQQLWYTYSSDSVTWAPDTQVPNLAMSGSPSAVGWAGGITVFHAGQMNDGQLWYTYSPDGTNWGEDTQVPNVGMTASPSALVF